MTKLTKTEALVLKAMRLRDAAAVEDIQRDIDRGWVTAAELRHTDRVLQGVQPITAMCKYVATGRKPGKLSVSDALQKLVARGLVERSDARVMGGGFALYIRTEA
jgi:predicted transcriptional regulator